MRNEDGYNANAFPQTKEFMQELIELCNKHKMAVVPSEEGERNFHDSMMIVPLEREDIRYIQGAIVYPSDFGLKVGEQ